MPIVNFAGVMLLGGGGEKGQWGFCRGASLGFVSGLANVVASGVVTGDRIEEGSLQGNSAA